MSNRSAVDFVFRLVDDQEMAMTTVVSCYFDYYQNWYFFGSFVGFLFNKLLSGIALDENTAVYVPYSMLA